MAYLIKIYSTNHRLTLILIGCCNTVIKKGWEHTATASSKIYFKRLQKKNIKCVGTLYWDTLEHQRLLAQATMRATMFYNILNGTVNISISHHFKPNPRLAGDSHHLRYYEVITKFNSYNYLFFLRFIPLWKILPVEAVSAPSNQGSSVAVLPIIRCLPPTASRYGW